MSKAILVTHPSEFSIDYVNYANSIEAIRRFTTDVKLMCWHLRQKSKKLNFPDPLGSKDSFILYLNALGFHGGGYTRYYVERLFEDDKTFLYRTSPEEWAEILLECLYWEDMCKCISDYSYVHIKRRDPIAHDMIATYLNDFMNM